VNVQEYISSGIVESYVLGLASPEEQREFERMCEQYPEVLDARLAFETALENQAMEHAIAPPADLRQTVINAAMNSGGAKVVSMSSAGRGSGMFKYAAAAAILLLAGSIFWNISLYKKNQRLSSDYTTLQANHQNTVARLENVQKDLQVIQMNPNLKMAAMKGLPAAPTASAVVYWDSTSKDVYLLINNLPMPASDKQYQLWALLDGKPIDVGMVKNEWFVGQKELLLRMKHVNGAQAFAVTLEKTGGNPTPEGTMYVLGNL